MFIENINGVDSSRLLQCLRVYATVGKQQIAEELFRTKIVLPYMEEVSI